MYNSDTCGGRRPIVMPRGRIVCRSVAYLALTGWLIVPLGCNSSDTETTDGESAYEVVDEPSGGSGSDSPGDSNRSDARSASRTNPTRPDASTSPGSPSRTATPSVPDATAKSPRSATTGASSSGTASNAAPCVPSGGGSVTKPPSIAAEKLNDYRVSGKTPQELMALVRSIDAGLRDLMQRPPRPDQQRQVLAKVRQSLQAKEEAAEQAFRACDDEKDRDLKFEAAQAKMQAMAMLANLQDTAVPRRVAAFAKEMVKSKDERLVSQGRGISLSLKVGELAAGKKIDLAQLLKDFEQALGAEKLNAALGSTVQQTVAVMTSLGHTKESIKLLGLAANAFGKQEGREMAEASLNFAHQAEVLKIGLTEKLSAATGHPSPENDQAFLDAVAQVAKLKSPHEAILFHLTQTLGLLEGAGRFDLCRSVAKTIRDLYGKHSEEQLKRIANGELENIEKRLERLNKPLEVTGMITSDGRPFDWAAYDGKVVLFDFWASQSPPWGRWAAELKKIYAEYHDTGFEVVGVNLDRNRAAADAIQKRLELKWPMTFSANLDRHAMADIFRVESLPFSILVDQKGVLVDMFLTPTRLRRQLDALLKDKKLKDKKPAKEPAEGPAKKASEPTP